VSSVGSRGPLWVAEVMALKFVAMTIRLPTLQTKDENGIQAFESGLSQMR